MLKDKNTIRNKIIVVRQLWVDKGRIEIFRIRAFRVLTVCKSSDRAKNLRDLSTQADPKRTGSFLFWFTSEQNFNIKQPQKILDKIWETAGDSRLHCLFE